MWLINFAFNKADPGRWKSTGLRIWKSNIGWLANPVGQSTIQEAWRAWFFFRNKRLQASIQVWHSMSCTFGTAEYSPKILKSEANVQHLVAATGINEDRDIRKGKEKAGPCSWQMQLYIIWWSRFAKIPGQLQAIWQHMKSYLLSRPFESINRRPRSVVDIIISCIRFLNVEQWDTSRPGVRNRSGPTSRLWPKPCLE